MRIITYLIFSLTLIGCASGKPTTFKSPSESPVEFLERMSVDLSKKLSYPDIAASKIKNQNHSYKRLSVEFIPFNVGSAGVQQSLLNYCNGLNATLQNGTCSNAEKILFFSKIKETGRVTGDGKELVVLVIEPTSENTTDDYIKIIRSFGYQTNNEIYLQSQKEMQLFTENTKVTLEKLETEKNLRKNIILNSKIGTRVCQWKNEFLYAGFIEDKSDQSVKILLSEAGYKGNFLIAPGGFAQKYIWDKAENWSICNG